MSYEHDERERQRVRRAAAEASLAELRLALARLGDYRRAHGDDPLIELRAATVAELIRQREGAGGGFSLRRLWGLWTGGSADRVYLVAGITRSGELHRDVRFGRG